MVVRYLIAALICLTQTVVALHESFNFVVKPQQRECFFEEISAEKATDGTAYKVDVFLQSGGNIDILLSFHGPLELSEVMSGAFENPYFTKLIDINLESEFDTQTYMADFSPSVAGHYAICLDNRASRFTSKTVQLDVSPKKSSALGEPIDPKAMQGKTSSEPEVDVQKVASAIKALKKIELGINHIQVQQQRDKHRLILHSDANDANYNEVFISSIIETLIFMGVSIFQIFFVRRWFAARLNANPATSKAKAYGA